MATLYQKEDILHPSTLQEAINIIKFLNTTHKEDMFKWKNTYHTQMLTIKKLEANRKKELDFLSSELQKYEINLASRTKAISGQLAEKDEVIKRQAEIIDELKQKLLFQSTESLVVPEIRVFNMDSNSDSGIVLEHDEKGTKPRTVSNAKTEIKNTKKCGRRLADSISFLKKVDFSPRKLKANTSSTKTVVEQRTKLDRLAVPLAHKFSTNRHNTKDLYIRPSSAEPILMESAEDSFMFRPKVMNDSMNNHLSDSDDSEEYFDRVMTRSSVRRSVNSNPKYKKINRAKSKKLEQVKGNIVD